MWLKSVYYPISPATQDEGAEKRLFSGYKDTIRKAPHNKQIVKSLHRTTATENIKIIQHCLIKVQTILIFPKETLEL